MNSQAVVGTRFLHVANGTCTTQIIESAGIPGRRSIWADPLYEGPVPGGLTDAALLQVRARFLAGREKPDVSLAWSGPDASLDPANDLGKWRSAIEDHGAYDELILWFEHDLFDQLNLVQLLTWIRERVPSAKAVSLVSVGSFPGHPAFKGLGELAPDELASLLDRRQGVSEEQYAVAMRAWDAFRASTPEALDDLRRGNTEALPFLAAAIGRFLQEYPWAGDGLSRTERRLLELAADRGANLATAFSRMHEGEDVYYVTDTSLAALAEGLCRTSPPLLMFAPGGGAQSGGLHGSVTLTDAGRAVMNARQDRVALCGIDRWLGGVHLQGVENVWRWDDARRRVVRA